MLGIRNGRQPQLDNTRAIVHQRAPGGTGRGEKEGQAVTVHGTITASGGDPRAHCTHRRLRPSAGSRAARSAARPSPRQGSTRYRAPTARTGRPRPSAGSRAARSAARPSTPAATDGPAPHGSKHRLHGGTAGLPGSPMRVGWAVRVEGQWAALVSGESRPRSGEIFAFFMQSRREWRIVVVTDVLDGQPGCWRVRKRWSDCGDRLMWPQRRPGGAVGAGRAAPGRRVNPATRCLRLFKVALEPRSMLTISTRGASRCGFVGSALVAV